MLLMLKYVVIVLFVITVIPAYADSHQISWNFFIEWQEWAYNRINYYEQIITGQKSEIDSLQDTIEQLEQMLVLQTSVTNPIIAGLIDGDLTYYIEPLPHWSTYDISLFDDYLNGRYEEGIKLQRVYDESLADFSVRWVKDYGDEYLGVAYAKTAVTVGLGSSNCGDWQHFDDFSITKIAWHEIGHVLGYGHSNDPNNIMYSTIHTLYNYDTNIEHVISSGWHWWYSFCNGGEQQFSLSTSTKENGIEIIALPPETDVSNFVDYGDGLYYLCTEYGEIWHKHNSTCNVDPGSKLVIINHENNAVRVEGWIKNLEGHPDVDMRWDDKAYEYNSEYLDYVWNLYNK